MNHSLFTTNGITDSDRRLHTPGSFAKNNLLYVQEVGRLKSLQPHVSQRENLDSYLIMAILSGEGEVTIKTEKYHVKKGDCLFINCKDNYSHESSEHSPWELYWVHFNGNSAQHYYELFCEKNGKENKFRPFGMKEVKDIIEKLISYQDEKNFQAELISGELLLKLVNFALMTVMYYGEERQEDTKAISKEIREYINAHYKDCNLLSILPQTFSLEEEKLNYNFQKVYGIALEDYILNRRFTVAKELLRFTIAPVDDIVQQSGIGDYQLFQKLFQDSENMTAEEYRMKWSQWVK